MRYRGSDSESVPTARLQQPQLPGVLRLLQALTPITETGLPLHSLPGAPLPEAHARQQTLALPDYANGVHAPHIQGTFDLLCLYCKKLVKTNLFKNNRAEKICSI